MCEPEQSRRRQEEEQEQEQEQEQDDTFFNPTKRQFVVCSSPT
jgi:hypothetical protein